MNLPRPEVTAAQPWAFPEPTQRTFDNGLRVVAYERPGQHVISSRLVVPGSVAAEPRAVEGVATLVSRTMDEGTEQHTGEELANLFEQNGIGLSAWFSEAGMVLELESTAAQLSRAYELATECLSVPVFDEDEVHRHQRQRLAEIEQAKANPGSRAALMWKQQRYSAQSRLSRPTGGGPETVAAITRADCVDYHRRHVGPRAATLVVAGDLPAEQVFAKVGASFAGWADTAQPAIEAPEAPVSDTAAGIVFIDRPGSVQTEIYLGTSGPDRRTPGGWAPYPVLSYALGGSPNARIDALLREDKGYTYGIRTVFRPRRRGGEFITAGSVRAEVTADALDLLMGVLDQAAEQGFTEEEVRAGVDYIGKTAPGRYATADVVADEAAMLALDGLGTDFVTSYLDDLATVSADRVNAAWSAITTGARWSTVLVGDAQVHADAVTALGRGTVRVVGG